MLNAAPAEGAVIFLPFGLSRRAGDGLLVAGCADCEQLLAGDACGACRRRWNAGAPYPTPASGHPGLGGYARLAGWRAAVDLTGEDAGEGPVAEESGVESAEEWGEEEWEDEGEGEDWNDASEEWEDAYEGEDAYEEDAYEGAEGGGGWDDGGWDDGGGPGARGGGGASAQASRGWGAGRWVEDRWGGWAWVVDFCFLLFVRVDLHAVRCLCAVCLLSCRRLISMSPCRSSRKTSSWSASVPSLLPSL